MNLITTDLQNVCFFVFSFAIISEVVTQITDARDFTLLLFMVPLQISLCIFVLYQLLGWR